jgi:hypothetical protein
VPLIATWCVQHEFQNNKWNYRFLFKTFQLIHLKNISGALRWEDTVLESRERAKEVAVIMYWKIIYWALLYSGQCFWRLGRKLWTKQKSFCFHGTYISVGADIQ